MWIKTLTGAVNMANATRLYVHPVTLHRDTIYEVRVIDVTDSHITLNQHPSKEVADAALAGLHRLLNQSCRRVRRQHAHNQRAVANQKGT